MNLKIVSIFALASALCFAESWTGKLVDITCAHQSKPEASKPEPCVVTTATKAFGIETKDGKLFKLDLAGNSKAADLFKITNKTEVAVSGVMNGETVKVDSIAAASMDH